MKTVQVGVIGCGGIAQMMHLPTLAERPDLFRIIALADVNPTVLGAVADRYHVDVRCTDWRDLVASDRVDAVVIASSGSHKDAVVGALERNKHVFSEKPLGIGMSELEEIKRALDQSRGRLMVGYHKRFDPAYQRAKKAVAQIEELRLAQVTVLHPDDNAYRSHHAILPIRPFAEVPESEIIRQTAEMIEADPYRALLDEVAGKGTDIAHRTASFLLYDSLLHDINAVRGMLGSPLEVLSAHHWNQGFAQSSLTRFEHDVHVQLNWISLPGIKHYEETLSFVGPRSRVKLIFPSPYLRHAPTELHIERMEGESLVEDRYTVSYEEAFRAEMHHFHQVITEGIRPAVSLDEAWSDAEWIDAIAGAYRGKPVRVTSDREADTFTG
jgi:predicted dehydrogenase